MTATTTKKKGAPKKKKAAPKDEFITVNLKEYGSPSLMTNAYNNMINSMLGIKNEELMTPDERIVYWRDKHNDLENKNKSLEAQVKLLQSIIDKALVRSCGANNDNY